MRLKISTIATRLAKPNDVSELCALLNEIIDIGGTTSLQTPLTDVQFHDKFLQGENHLSCYVALDEMGHLAGFQTIERHAELPTDWADIATFARLQPKLKGVGSALFTETYTHAKQVGVVAINASIRTYNKGGLIFYEKMGFETYDANTGSRNRTGATQISKCIFVK